MKKIELLVNLILFAGYISFSFLTLNECSSGENEYNPAGEGESAVTANRLKAKFGAVEFDALHPISDNPVILDSLVIGVKEKVGRYFVKTEIMPSANGNYFAELEFSPWLYREFQSTKSNRLLICAKIDFYCESDLYFEVNSIDGKRTLFKYGRSVLLKGKCFGFEEKV